MLLMLMLRAGLLGFRVLKSFQVVTDLLSGRSWSLFIIDLCAQFSHDLLSIFPVVVKSVTCHFNEMRNQGDHPKHCWGCSENGRANKA